MKPKTSKSRNCSNASRRPGLSSVGLLLVQAGLMAAPLAAGEPGAYALREAEQYVRDRGGEPIPHVVTSEHFALKWGTANDLKYDLGESYVQHALEYFERIRAVYKDQVGLPLVKAEAGRFKTNIYITRTGLKPFLEGYAFGFADPEGYGVFTAEPSVMTPGHGAAAHEMGHATQGETGNFRDSDYVGWFWECHAQFMAQQVNPTSNLPESLDLFCDMSRFDWSTAVNWHQYSGWIFLQYLAEKPGYGYPFINRLWLTRAAYQDEDPVSKMIRLGRMDAREWGDLYGDFASRNVTFASYRHGREYKASLDRVAARDERRLSRWMAALEPVKGRSDWYAMPYAGAPHQNAYNVVPLFPKEPKVTVEFHGLRDPARESDWRATLVVVNRAGGERFSETVSRGAMTVRLGPDETSLYLVVAAVPHVFKPIKFLEDYRTQERFPYEVKIRGAVPRGVGPDVLPGDSGLQGAPHPNGGGFVASTASVEPGVYVGPQARVLERARITGRARIEDCAVVGGEACVSDEAIVGGHARVTGKAQVGGKARVRDWARVYDEARIEGGARVFEYALIQGKSLLRGNAVARGSCTVTGITVGGTACFTGASNPSFEGRHGAENSLKEAVRGVFTGYVSQADYDKGEDLGGLVARYDFSVPNELLLVDSVATGNGILRGEPRWVRTPARVEGLRFNGRGQYGELPRSVSDLRDMEIAIWVNWAGGAPGQRILDFGRDESNCMYLTPCGDNGGLAFVMAAGGRRVVVGVPTPLPVGKGCKVGLMLKKGIAELKVDEATVATGQVPANPEDLRADANYLARGQAGGFFKGMLSDVTIRSIEDL